MIYKKMLSYILFTKYVLNFIRNRGSEMFQPGVGGGRGSKCAFVGSGTETKVGNILTRNKSAVNFPLSTFIIDIHANMTCPSPH